MNFSTFKETIRSDKEANLKKMKDLVGLGGKIIIVDELLRPGLKGREDKILNKIYNFRVPGPYMRMCLDGYRYLFAECKLKILGEINYNRGTYLWVLEA